MAKRTYTPVPWTELSGVCGEPNKQHELTVALPHELLGVTMDGKIQQFR